MIDRLPPLAPLRFFALVAETGSLTAAAARLNVTQPAVSRRLRELEAAVGVPLVQRGANALRLTPAGARYAAAIAESLAGIEAATRALTEAPGGPFRIRAYATWALRWLIPRLPHFYRAHPLIELEVATSHVDEVDFLRDRLDAAIRAAPTPPVAGAVLLQPVAIAPFATPAVARRIGPGPGGIAALTLLGSTVRPRHWAIWAAGQPQPLPMPAPLLFDGTALAIQAALEGLGAVVAPPAFVENEVRRRRLRRLAPGAVPTGDHYWLVVPPGPPSPRAIALRDWLLQEYAAPRR